MLLLIIAGVFTSIACATTVGTGLMSGLGKALGVVVAAIGIALGVTAGTVASGIGATAPTNASIGILTGSLAIIAGNFAVRRIIRKAEIQRHY